MNRDNSRTDCPRPEVLCDLVAAEREGHRTAGPLDRVRAHAESCEACKEELREMRRTRVGSTEAAAILEDLVKGGRFLRVTPAPERFRSFFQAPDLPLPVVEREPWWSRLFAGHRRLAYGLAAAVLLMALVPAWMVFSPHRPAPLVYRGGEEVRVEGAEPQGVVEALGDRIAWKAVKGAEVYQVQLFTVGMDLLDELESDTASVELSDEQHRTLEEARGVVVRVVAYSHRPLNDQNRVDVLTWRFQIIPPTD